MPPTDPHELIDRAREEFLAEASELVDGVVRDLLALDEAFKRGREDAETLHNVFRGVHTLKGLAGLVGQETLARLSHGLEDLLDQLRLGRVAVTQQVIDLLFRAVELLARLLDGERGAVAPEGAEVDAVLTELRHEPREAAEERGEYDLDPEIFSVLTEYEEHRLRVNLANHVPLYRVRGRFPLAAIDQALEELKALARSLGEIITYLPTGGGGGDALELDVLLASSAPIDQVRARLEAADRVVLPVARLGPEAARRASLSLPPVPPAPALPALPPLPGLSVMVPGHDVLAEEAPAALGNAERAREHEGQDDDLAARHGAARAIHTVRVDIRRLDRLLNVLSELSLVRSALGRLTERARQGAEARALTTELARLGRAFDRNLAGLQRGILEVRMVPLGQVFERLVREVRKISRELTKEVRLVVTGAETAVDKLIAEELGPPLLHLVRNAIDHGIEAPAVRAAAGKDPEGTIAFNAYQAGNRVVIEVEDDGAGIDPRRIGEVALERGLVAETDLRAMGRGALFDLVFVPGFSTRDRVTELSGRGVGMDVVKTNIARLGGVVEITSEVGVFTKVSVTVPTTLAILTALVVGVAGRRYAVPLSAIHKVARLAVGDVRRVDAREVTTLDGQTVPLCRLDALFEHARPTPAPLAPYAVVVALGGRRVGFVVDELVGQRDIVVKPLGPSLRHVRGFTGATDLGDQRVALVLDTLALLDEALAGPRAAVAPSPGGRAP